MNMNFLRYPTQVIHKECVNHRLLIAGLFMVLALVLNAQEEPREHVVQGLDNFYSISLKYDVSIDALKNANPGIVHPKPGDVLIIPQNQAAYEEEIGNCKKIRPGKGQLYRVALMIPLYLEQTLDTAWSRQLDPQRINETGPFRFIQFYHGFMMAADSMKKAGVDLQVNVYDVDQSMSKAYRALSDPALRQADLIIGPFFRNSFSAVADFAQANRIPIVNPISPRQDILVDNPFVFKVMPQQESQPGIVARLVNRDFSGHNVMIYTANPYQGAAEVRRLREAVENAAPGRFREVPVIDYSADSIAGFKKHAKFQEPNLVIIYAENESLPAALLSKLSALRNDYPVTVICLPEWDKFSNLESVYMVALNAVTLSAAFADHEKFPVRDFVTSYRNRYFDEPQDLAFTGFDIGYYFISALMNYGDRFVQCLDELNVPLILNQFEFDRLQPGYGFVNCHWNVLRYDGYRLTDQSINSR